MLRDELRQRNFDLEGLDLSLTKRVPEGADLILIISPQGRFQPFEEELLRQYLSTGAGRIILTIDPARECGLGNLFYDWGVRVDDDVIHDDTNSEFIADNGDLIIRNFDGAHPITKIADRIQVFPCASARRARSGPIPTGRSTTPSRCPCWPPPPPPRGASSATG